MAVDLLKMIGGANQRAVLYKSCATGQLSLPPNLLRDVASGKALTPHSLEDCPQEERTFTILAPEERPIAIVQAAFEMLGAHQPFRAAWIFADGRTPEGAPMLPWKLLVLMKPRDATIFHDLNLVVRSAAGDTDLGLADGTDEALMQSLMQSGNPFFVRQS